MNHCILTASSLSPHDRKGREGKGNRKGRGRTTVGLIHRYGLYRAASSARFARLAAPTMDGGYAEFGGGR